MDSFILTGISCYLIFLSHVYGPSGQELRLEVELEALGTELLAPIVPWALEGWAKKPAMKCWLLPKVPGGDTSLPRSFSTCSFFIKEKKGGHFTHTTRESV